MLDIYYTRVGLLEPELELFLILPVDLIPYLDIDTRKGLTC